MGAGFRNRKLQGSEDEPDVSNTDQRIFEERRVFVHSHLWVGRPMDQECAGER
jgi:hypothetical protein